MTLVYRLPGPSTTRSARASAATACGSGARRLGREPDAPRQALGGGDRALAAHLPAALELRVQHDVVERGGQHAAAHLEHVRGLLHGALEVAGHLGERGHEQVAEAVALQAAVVGEAVLEELAHQRLVVGERDQAVAQVAGRRHAHVAAQQPGAAAVVGHRHDGGEVAGVRLEAAQQGGEAVAAADRGHARPARQPAGRADLARRLGRRRWKSQARRAPIDEGERRRATRPSMASSSRGPVPVCEPAHARGRA